MCCALGPGPPQFDNSLILLLSEQESEAMLRKNRQLVTGGISGAKGKVLGIGAAVRGQNLASPR